MKRKYSEVQDKVSTLMKKWNGKGKSDSDKKHLTTEIKSYGDKITTSFNDIKAPSRDSFDFYRQNKLLAIVRAII